MIDYAALAPFVLYELFKKGDERAFEALYYRYSMALFNHCVRLLSDWHHAEDVVVETFTKLARSNLRPDGSLKAWLYRVATNQCYKHLRKRQGIAFSEEAFVPHEPEMARQKNREMQVQKLLSQLSEGHRVVMVLKFYDGMTYQEIADVLCCPLGTVKSRIHEGMKHLRRLMNGTMRNLCDDE
jgi:RNA polymerase sigma-70 factor (ECF subfamily)